jgi:hypothetical protein
VLDIRLGLSCSIVREEVYKALGRSYSLRACKDSMSVCAICRPPSVVFSDFGDVLVERGKSSTAVYRAAVLVVPLLMRSGMCSSRYQFVHSSSVILRGSKSTRRR